MFSLNPTHENDSKGDGEFNFWGSESECGERFEQEFDDKSLRLWNTSRCRNEAYPLLPQNHDYSNNISRSRLREARKELMERICDMPECGYELSLKDIVDLEENKTSTTEMKKHKTQKSKRSGKSGQMSRNASMEKETLMIKLFIPTSLFCKSRLKGSKVVPDQRSSRSSSSSSCFFPACWPIFRTKRRQSGPNF
ncbi:uncharacterized protein LOC126657486 [Mercurialis annua]|uniref:uncharacterized protein LOC126657486 n=1 Tax=Mercurialis annua TaxID=3986 RepID=UPI0021610709|nr:uncharacterized protein LOC126657486 [Mercurialis annua]